VAAPTPTAAVAADDALSTRLLLQRARRLLWLALLPLLAGVVLLAAWQAHAQWQRLLAEVLAEARTHRPAFDAAVRDAGHHVADLQRWMEQAYLRDDGQPAPGILQALQPRRARDGTADGHTLDGLTGALRPGMAQLLWPQGDGQGPPPAVLRRAEALSAVFEIAHQRNPNLAWSWFFGWPSRHRVLYPWVPSRALVEEGGAADLAQALAGWYAQPLLLQALPDHNPTRQAYWTPPWFDPTGKGLLVSRAAPVVVADEVRGVVGADLRLGMLDALMDRLPAAPWRAWLVDDQGHVLADRQQPLHGVGPLAAVPLLAQRLPAALDAGLIARAAAGAGQALPAGHLRVVAVTLNEVPWTLVLAAPERALLKATLPQVLPYTAILAALLLLGVGAQAMLRQRVVTPLFGIFDYLQRLSADAATPEPRLSPRWQPWVRVVTRTFASMRAAAQGERRAEALKSAIVDHALAAVVVADADDRIVEFNAAAEAMLGLPRSQALGRTVRGLVQPPRFHAAYDLARARMRQGDPDGLLGRRMARTIRRADDRELPVEVVMWLTQVDGADYFTASITDLSAARASAEVIARQREALRQSEKLGAMGSLLAGVAHELNNPLAIVMGRASLLEEKAEGTPLHDDARRIREAAERCGRIVRTFLNMARSRPARHAPVQLNDLVRAAADMLGYTLRSHGIELELRLAADLPEVQADGDQVGQVVLNLIVNAQQALAAAGRPGDLPRIAVHSGLDSAGGGRRPLAWLRVCDNGPGVQAEVRGRLFEPFFTTKAEGMGTGLGLSVSRAIARDHGGDLLLEDADATDRGACFRLQLPLHATPPQAPPPPAEPDGAATARVLVVDDEADITELLRALLEGAGYDVATAESGAVALEMLDTARFDAIVSDLRMPDIDGAALWRIVRERHPALARRWLFVTGDALSPDASRFLDTNGCARLDKPFAKGELLARLKALLAA
jgi:PAS domain S-box-containing protein